MKKQLLKMILASAVIICSCFNKSTAQTWNLTGNSDATSTSTIGTLNSVALSLSTKGTKRMYIDTLGRVGFNTTTPVGRLTLKANGGNPVAAWTTGSTSPIYTSFSESTSGTSDNIYAMATNIATAKPQFIYRRSRGTLAIPLTLANGDNISSLIAGGYDGSAFQNSSSIDFVVDGAPLLTSLPASISFSTGTSTTTRTERLKIGSNGNISFNTNQFTINKSTGNVGIGTITPSQKLEINGTAAINGSLLMDIANTNDGTLTSGGFIRFGNTYSGEGILSKRTAGGNQNGLDFFAGDASRMTINNAGFVGIGNTAPAYKLDVKGNEIYLSKFTNTHVGIGDYTALAGECQNTPYYGVGLRGVGGFIGTEGYATLVGTGERYGVTGTASGGTSANYGVYGMATGSGNFGVYSSGPTYSTGGYTSSDAKLKKEITVFENAMDKVNQLIPRSYTFKTNEYEYMNLPEGKQYGFIAQELETVFPEMVRDVVQPKDLKNKEKGNVAFKAINYSELIPVLTKALQEQNTMINELKQRIESLENKITTGEVKNQNILPNGEQNVPSLYQNNPNPFNEKTTIHYNTPLTCKKATIKIMNMEGRELQNISITKNGEGKVIISANTLPAGTYFYQLITDGSASITRKMVLAK